MNLHKRIAQNLALATVLGLTAMAAHAAPLSKGNFTLPVKAYWGNTLLPAGDYTLSVNRELSGIDLVFVRSQDFSATIMAPAGAAAMAECSCLKVDDLGGTYVIRELGAGVQGRSYKFPVSKAARNLTLRGAATQPAEVPLSSAAGL